MKKFLVLFVIAVVAVAGLSFAGSSERTKPQKTRDNLVINNLIREGFTDEQIEEIMQLPRFPYVDDDKQLATGDQLLLCPDGRCAIVFSVMATEDKSTKLIQRQAVLYGGPGE